MAKKKPKKTRKPDKKKVLKPITAEKPATETTPKDFFTFLFHHKYDYHDFLEPLLALPFAYGLLRILEGQFNTLTFVIIFVLLLIYLPTIIVFTEYARQQ